MAGIRGTICSAAGHQPTMGAIMKTLTNQLFAARKRAHKAWLERAKLVVVAPRERGRNGAICGFSMKAELIYTNR